MLRGFIIRYSIGEKTLMKPRRPNTFRSTETMDKYLEMIMEERDLDRTSVIKLALYKLCCYMEKEDVKKMDLFELVADLEAEKPDGFPPFGVFADH